MKLKIGYLPFAADKGNSYVDRMRKLLSKFGEVTAIPTPNYRLPLLHFLNRETKFDVAILNWPENVIINKRGRISIVGIAKLCVKLIWWKTISEHQIFVRHNNYPHEATGLSKRIAASAINTLEKLVTITIVHSRHLADESHRIYVPHPLYKSTAKSEELFTEPKEYFVLFGRILPYKKIDEVIKALPPGKRLIVAGACDQPDYAALLKALSIGTNVEIRAGYIDDVAAESLVSKSSGLIISHSDGDMIVSGSYFYAATLGVPVFALETPFFNWLKSNTDVNGLSLFKTISDLTANLTQKSPDARKQIMQWAFQNFGDEAVSEAISTIITKFLKS